MKRFLFLLTLASVLLLASACGNRKNNDTEPVIIDSTNVDSYLLSLPEYDKITVKIDKSEFSEELTDDYIERYYERLADGIEGLTDEEGNLLPLSNENVKRLDNPAFSDVNEFKVFVRKTVESFIDRENEDKKIEAALETLRSEATFGELPKEYIKGFEERVLSGYEGTALKYDVSSNEYLEFAGISLEDECLKAAQDELVFIKLADRIGLSYSNDAELEAGVREYLLGIIKVSK